MARTGKFGGFDFDEEVFGQMMQEVDYWKNPVLASGVVQQDSSIMNLIGDRGNVATIPIYKPLNAYDADMGALNNDGLTDNTPVEITGDKQTCMLIQRMKAFKAKDFTKELTGADPLTNIRNKVAGYYVQVWENELMNIAKAVLGVADLSSHVLDLAADGKPLEIGTVYDAEQAALGDMAGGLGLLVMHSMTYAWYLKKGMVEFEKYVTGTGAIKTEIQLPAIAGKKVMVTDYYTAESNGIYNTYLFGEGAFLSCDKNNYEKQYTTDYDPESSAGVEKFYTKQGKVLHPNGLSLAVDNIEKESPTYAELGLAENWTLKFNAKNVKMGVVKHLVSDATAA